jgi:hypothetical protein
LAEKTQVQDIGTEPVAQAEEAKPEEKPREVSPERIQRMKRAFRPTWLYEQINSAPKNSGKKE